MVSKGKVIPRNPKTESQTETRLRFRRIQQAVQQWSPELYRRIFNNSIGNLPGFQSLESALKNAPQEDGTLAAIEDISTGNQFGWSSGTIDFGDTNPDEIVITINRASGDYPPGTRLNAFAWVTYDGDWRTESDNEFLFEYTDLVSGASQIDVTLGLSEELTQNESIVLVGVVKQDPPNSFRLSSITQTYAGARGEIQDMKNSGKI